MKLRKRFGVVLVLAMLVSMLAMTVTASAAKLNKKKATITVGKTVTLKVKGTSAKATWSSSDEEVATVSSKGKVKGVSEGTATIKAKVGSKTYKCKVTVKAAGSTPEPTPSGNVEFKNIPNNTVYLYGEANADTANVVSGHYKFDLKPFLSPAGVAATWTTSNADVAVVNNGVVQAVTNGSATITATTSNGSASVVVVVNGMGGLDDGNPIVLTKANFDKLFYRYFEKVTIMQGYFDADGKIMVPTGNQTTGTAAVQGAMMNITWTSGPLRGQSQNIDLAVPYREFVYWVVKDPNIDVLQSFGTASVRFWENEALADVEGRPGAPFYRTIDKTVAWTADNLILRSVCRYWDDVNGVYVSNTFPAEQSYTFTYTDFTRSGKPITKTGTYFVAKYSNPAYAGRQLLSFRLDEALVMDGFYLPNVPALAPQRGMHNFLAMTSEDATKEYWEYFFPSDEVFDALEVTLYKR